MKTKRNHCSINVENDASFGVGTSPCINFVDNKPFKGQMDELRVYGRALVEDEINKLFNE